MDSTYTTQAKDLGLIKTLQYPLDIGAAGPASTSNFMLIYINELETTKWATHKKRPISAEARANEAPSIQRSNTSFSSFADKAKNKLDDKVEDVTGSNIIDAVFPSYNRTSYVIALPLPEQLNTSYNSDWGMSEMTSMGVEAMEMLTGDGSVKDKALERLKTSLGSNAAKMALGKDAATSLTKSIRNPRKEMLYYGHQPRGFNFTWTLFPRNEEESKALWDITQMLKLQSLPELNLGQGTDSGFWIDFPSTFEFEFYTNNQRNDWLFKSSTCALTSLDVNMTPTGTATFFKSSKKQTLPGGNAPNGIALSLTFMEMETLFKNRIDMNGNFMFNTDQSGSVGGVL